jgi:hypothetical protein
MPIKLTNEIIIAAITGFVSQKTRKAFEELAGPAGILRMALPPRRLVVRVRSLQRRARFPSGDANGT